MNFSEILILCFFTVLSAVCFVNNEQHQISIKKLFMVLFSDLNRFVIKCIIRHYRVHQLTTARLRLQFLVSCCCCFWCGCCLFVRFFRWWWRCFASTQTNCGRADPGAIPSTNCPPAFSLFRNSRSVNLLQNNCCLVSALIYFVSVCFILNS